MNILNQTIENLYLSTSNNINGVGYGYKYINNNKTDQKSIVFYVNIKKPIEQLSESEILPKYINIDNTQYMTDVIEKSSLVNAITCYTNFNTDPEILRLQGDPTLLEPIKGGQEIIQYPTNWSSGASGTYNYYIGTLGFCAVDNIDNKVIGVTNAHVVCSKFLLASDRIKYLERKNPYNTYEPIPFIVNNTNHRPGALSLDNLSGSLNVVGENIKRYSPLSSSGINYIDVALLIMDNDYINSTSYQIHEPTTATAYSGHYPFATTSEIDDLLSSNPYLYSTGRTTGPKGWGSDSSCRLVVTQINTSILVSYTNPDLNDEILLLDFGDLIEYAYEDGSNFPVAGGDSGSVLLADFSGTKKIIGIVFAGDGGTFDNPSSSTHHGYACRIDRVVNELNIREWNNTYTFNNSYPQDIRILTCDFDDSLSSQKTLSYSGITYYQIGCTTGIYSSI